MNRTARLKANLQVLRKYVAARAALYGCRIREILADLEHVTNDGGKTLITAEYWAELHAGYQHDELLRHMPGVAMDTIRESQRLEDELDSHVSREPSELLERVG